MTHIVEDALSSNESITIRCIVHLLAVVGRSNRVRKDRIRAPVRSQSANFQLPTEACFEGVMLETQVVMVRSANQAMRPRWKWYPNALAMHLCTVAHGEYNYL